MTRAVSHNPFIDDDDKRLIPNLERVGNGVIQSERRSDREWHYCTNCAEDAPTFVLTQTAYRDHVALHSVKIRCCWQCGHGIELLEDAE